MENMEDIEGDEESRNPNDCRVTLVHPQQESLEFSWSGKK